MTDETESIGVLQFTFRKDGGVQVRPLGFGTFTEFVTAIEFLKSDYEWDAVTGKLFEDGDKWIEHIYNERIGNKSRAKKLTEATIKHGGGLEGLVLAWFERCVVCKHRVYCVTKLSKELLKGTANPDKLEACLHLLEDMDIESVRSVVRGAISTFDISDDVFVHTLNGTLRTCGDCQQRVEIDDPIEINQTIFQSCAKCPQRMDRFRVLLSALTGMDSEEFVLLARTLWDEIPDEPTAKDFEGVFDGVV